MDNKKIKHIKRKADKQKNSRSQKRQEKRQKMDQQWEDDKTITTDHTQQDEELSQTSQPGENITTAQGMHDTGPSENEEAHQENKLKPSGRCCDKHIQLQSELARVSSRSDYYESLNHDLNIKCNRFDNMKKHNLHDRMSSTVSSRVHNMVDIAVFSKDFYKPSEYLDSIKVPKLMDIIPDIEDDAKHIKNTNTAQLYISEYKGQPVCLKWHHSLASADHECKMIMLSGSHKCLPYCYGLAHFTSGLEECVDLIVMTHHGNTNFRKYSTCNFLILSEPNNVMDILTNIGSVIHQLHSRCIVHNNLCPESILCQNPQNPYLIGFSRACPEPLCRPLNKKQLEDNAYAAPELHRGEAPSCASDIYAYGRIVSDVLMVLGQDYEIPSACIKAVQKCIHAEPSIRPQTRGLLTLLSEIKCLTFPCL